MFLLSITLSFRELKILIYHVSFRMVNPPFEARPLTLKDKQIHTDTHSYQQQQEHTATNNNNKNTQLYTQTTKLTYATALT